MKQDIIQDDFGGFNPRFMGVSIMLGSPEAYEVLIDYMLNDQASYYGDEKTSLQEIAIKSVLEHEIRHYHDFLTSPYSNYIFRLRLMALGNGASALSEAQFVNGNCLPIPITTWLTINNLQRKQQIEEWNGFTKKPLMPVQLPTISKDDLLVNSPPIIVDVEHLSPQEKFEAYVLHSSKAYKRIEQIVEGFALDKKHNEVKPCNVYEVTALTIQIATIYQSQGLIPSLNFMDFLVNSNLSYAKLWSDFFNVALFLEKKNSSKSSEETLGWKLAIMMCMAEWCLLGNYGIEGKEACPTRRFERLLEHLLDDYTFSASWEGDVDSLWAHWDKKTSVTPWRKSLETLLAFNKRGGDFYKSLVKIKKNPISDILEEVLQVYSRQQEVMINHLLTTPEKLVYPTDYLNAPHNTFPQPYLRLEFDNFGIAKTSQMTQGNFLKILEQFEHNGETYVKSFLLRLTKKEDTFFETATTSEELMKWCDIIFSTHSISGNYFAKYKKNVQDLTKKELFTIL